MPKKKDQHGADHGSGEHVDFAEIDDAGRANDFGRFSICHPYQRNLVQIRAKQEKRCQRCRSDGIPFGQCFGRVTGRIQRIRTCANLFGAPAISTIPPALSTIGPNVSIVRMNAAVINIPIVATAVPYMPPIWVGISITVAPCVPIQ